MSVITGLCKVSVLAGAVVCSSPGSLGFKLLSIIRDYGTLHLLAERDDVTCLGDLTLVPPLVPDTADIARGEGELLGPTSGKGLSVVRRIWPAAPSPTPLPAIEVPRTELTS